MKKTLKISIAAVILLLGASPCRLLAQSYDQVLTQIVAYENLKKITPATAGPELDSIIQGMIYNEGGYLAEGLKRRLVGYSSSTLILKQAAAAETAAEGNLLELLFYTRQNPVPVFITDADLHNWVVRNGAAIKLAELGFWKGANIDKTNVIEALGGFPPATAAVLVDVVSDTWYQAGNSVYERIGTSWASESLWQVYKDVRKVEFAKHSVVVKLLGQQGYITIPSVTYAEFEWSGAASVPIYLDPVTLGHCRCPWPPKAAV